MVNIKRKPCLFLGTLLSILLLVMLIVPLIGCNKEASKPQITLSVIEGRVDYQKQGVGKWTQVIENIPIDINDHVLTKHISRALLSLPDGSKILLEPGTELTVELFEQENTSRVARIQLIEGKINADVAKSSSPNSLLEIVTKDSVVAVVGTKLTIEDREGTDFSVDLLEGVAHVAHVTADVTTGEPTITFYSQTEGTALKLEKNAAEYLSSEERESILKVGEFIVSSGPEAINEVKASGDIEKGVERAKEVMETDSDMASTFNKLGVDDSLPERDVVAAAFNADDMGLGGDSNKDTMLREGSFFAPSKFNAGAGVLLGEAPELNALINNFDQSFSPPQSVNLFNEQGEKIGEQPPPAIVFDQFGEPIGRQPHPPVIFDPSGNIGPNQAPPDFVMIKDPFGDKLIAVAPEQLILPTLNKGMSESGLQGHQLAPPVIFDESQKL
ncbi:FecR domain-containing protein [Chloroflexota bacterium]